MTDQQDLRARLLARAEDLSDLDLMDRGTASLLREAAAQLGRVGDVDYVPGALDASSPTRVWLQIDTDGDNDTRDEPWPGSEHVTWHDESIGGLEIQYVRADLVSPQLPAGVPEFTTGHCANKKAPGGCKLHNLQCGYPECDKRASTPQPDNAAPGGRIDPNDGAFAGTACRMAAQIGVAYGAKEKCQIGAPFFAFTVTELVNFARAIAAISASKENSAAPGGDVERLREALENLISVAEPMAAEDGKCPPIREPNERGGTTVTIDPFPLLKYRVEDMDDLREGIKSARAIIAALSAPKQVGGLPDAVLLDRGFQIKDGVVTPTLLFGFNPDDWAARDRFAAMINTSPQAAPVPVEGEGPAEAQILAAMQAYSSGKNDFRESIRRALIAANTPPPSQPAVELERNEAAKLAKGLRESAIAMRALHGGIYAKWNDRADECDKAAALIDGAKAGKGEGHG